MKAQRTFKSFWKYLVYTGLFLIGTQIVAANSLKLDWKLLVTAVVIGCIKAAMTWFSTSE